MLDKEEVFYEIAKLNFNVLKESFGPQLRDSPSILPILLNSESSFPLFFNEFSVSNFLKRLADDTYSKRFLKDCASIDEAYETIKLIYHISLFDYSRKHNTEIMTQLDLYSKIVQEDPLLSATLQLIQWLEDIYPIPSNIVKSVIDFNLSAKLQQKLPPEKQLSFDIDAIATATDLEMDPKERQELKELMRSVYYLVRKGKLAKAEELLESSGQVMYSLK